MEDHYKVVPDGALFFVRNETEENFICSSHWRCNADEVCSALNAHDRNVKRIIELEKALDQWKWKCCHALEALSSIDSALLEYRSQTKHDGSPTDGR